MWRWNTAISFVPETGIMTFPEGMCTNTFTPTSSYFSHEDVPCADKATHTVIFSVWSHDSDNPGGWDDFVMHLCDRCKDLLADETDKDAEIMRTVSITPYLGEYDGQDI